MPIMADDSVPNGILGQVVKLLMEGDSGHREYDALPVAAIAFSRPCCIRFILS